MATKQRSYKTWAQCWEQLVALCSQTAIQFDRNDYALVADMQDAIERIPVLELPKRYAELTPHQREHFIFIAGIVLHPQTFAAVMKCTVLDQILTEKEAEVKALRQQVATFRNANEQAATRINDLKDVLTNVSELAWKALQ